MWVTGTKIFFPDRKLMNSFRFNHIQDNLYLLILKMIRNHPLRSP